MTTEKSPSPLFLFLFVLLISPPSVQFHRTCGSVSPGRTGVGVVVGDDDDDGPERVVAVFVLPYSLLRSSAERERAPEAEEQQPSPSHHRMNAFQCLSFLRVDESPTTISPDLALVTEEVRERRGVVTGILDIIAI
jgi:hypothetical protein